MTVFHKRLQQRLDEKKMKAADLAKVTGISPGAISRYLSDSNKEPMGSYLVKIAKALAINIEWLFGDSDEKKPYNVPSVVKSYEKLSDTDKQKVDDFALFLLNSKKDEPAGGE